MSDGVRSKKFERSALPPRPNKRSQKGFTIIELLIGIAVVALILAAAASLIKQLFAGSNITRETQNINVIMSQMRSIRSAAGYGANGADLVPLLIKLELAPAGLVNGTTLVNAWNGDVSVKSTGLSFAIGYEKVPKEDCAKLVTNLSQAGTFESIAIGGAVKRGPVAIAEAETLCADKDENTLIFTSRR